MLVRHQHFGQWPYWQWPYCKANQSTSTHNPNTTPHYKPFISSELHCKADVLQGHFATNPEAHTVTW